jgi:hypothetical protein
MPRNDLVEINPGSWVELTAGDVTALSVHNVGAARLWVQATVGAIAPAGFQPIGRPVCTTDGFDADKTLAELFPGVAGANRVWAFCQGMIGHAFVSHG